MRRFQMTAVALTMFFVGASSVSAYSENENNAKNVKLIEDGKERYYLTDSNTVEEFLEERGITLGIADEYSPSLDTMLENKPDITYVSITRAFPVILNLDGVPRMELTTGGTVQELLQKYKDDLPKDYILESTYETAPLSENMVIKLTSVKTNIYTTTEIIPFETETIETDKLDYGIERITQQGSEGELKITYTETYEGGIKVKTQESSREIVVKPVNTIIEKGTARAIEIAETGTKTSYQKAMNVRATAYTPFDPGCTGITATGIPATKGVIAVDPKIIPLGTKVYIPGYGNAVAADTGGAIKGNKIDVCLPTKNEAYQWGVRNVTIYILE